MTKKGPWFAVIAGLLGLVAMALFVWRQEKPQLIPHDSREQSGVIPSPMARNPLQAYEGFYAALAAGRSEESLRFLTPEAKADFQADTARDPDIIARQVAHKAELHEVFVQNCGPHEPGCRRRAVYGYRYEVREAYTENIDGFSFQVSLQTFDLEMVFIEQPDGTWLISEL